MPIHLIVKSTRGCSALGDLSYFHKFYLQEFYHVLTVKTGENPFCFQHRREEPFEILLEHSVLNKA